MVDVAPYGNALDHADVSPDSNPSWNTWSAQAYAGLPLRRSVIIRESKDKPLALDHSSGGGHHRGSGHSPLGLSLPPQ